MNTSHPTPTRRPLATLLGSGLVVVLSGWVCPLDGGALESDGGLGGPSPWDDSASLAWVLTTPERNAGHYAATAATAVITQGPRLALSPRRQRAHRWGPTRLGLTLPPMVCLVDVPEPSDLLSPTPPGGAIEAAREAHPISSRHPALPSRDEYGAAGGERYRLAPKGSPPA